MRFGEADRRPDELMAARKKLERAVGITDTLEAVETCVLGVRADRPT